MQTAKQGERCRSVQKSQRGRLPFCVYRNCNTDEMPTLTLEPMPTLSLLIDKRRQYIWTYICIFRSQILRNDDNNDDDVARWSFAANARFRLPPLASVPLLHHRRVLYPLTLPPFLSRCLPLRQLLLLLKCNANNKVAVHIYAICHAILFKHTESHRRRIEAAQTSGRQGVWGGEVGSRALAQEL